MGPPILALFNVCQIRRRGRKSALGTGAGKTPAREEASAPPAPASGPREGGAATGESRARRLRSASLPRVSEARSCGGAGGASEHAEPSLAGGVRGTPAGDRGLRGAGGSEARGPGAPGGGGAVARGFGLGRGGDPRAAAKPLPGEAGARGGVRRVSPSPSRRPRVSPAPGGRVSHRGRGGPDAGPWGEDAGSAAARTHSPAGSRRRGTDAFRTGGGSGVSAGSAGSPGRPETPAGLG